MKFLYLLLTTFFSALGIGYAKFFVLGYFSTEVYTTADKPWLIQAISAVMTFGSALAYVVSAPLASSFTKRIVMSLSAGVIVLILILGYFNDWPGTAWLYLFLIGVTICVFSAGKMATIPIEASDSGKSTYVVNGSLSVIFIFGMLSGIPLGTYMYEKNTDIGIWLGITFFISSGLFSLFLKYKKETCTPFGESISLLAEDSIILIFKYFLYLFSAPMIWGVAGAISLAVTAYAEINLLGSATACSFMSLFAAIGVILGNALSIKFTAKRYIASTIAGIIIVFLILSIPIFVETGLIWVKNPTALFYPLALLMIMLGLCFGVCTNLIDAEYLQHVGNDNKEGTGAALHSFFISVFSFSVGGLVGLSIIKGWMNPITQFIVLSAISAVGISFIITIAIKSDSINKQLSFIISRMFRFLISLRYKVKLDNIDKIEKNKNGILFLPNHPAEMDPIILCTQLWDKFKIHPVVVETFYHMPMVNKLLKIMGAFPMPDTSTGTGIFKKRRINQTMDEICNTLNNGDAVLMYPSGKLMRSGKEVLGAASGVHRILQQVENIQIVLVRTTGLWGSSFSTALTNGRTPDLKKSLFAGALTLIKNLIFFTPKRIVTVEFSQADFSLNRSMNNLEINQKLEEFYNANGEEPVSLVSYSYFSNKIPEANILEVQNNTDISKIPKETIGSIIDSFVTTFKLNKESISTDSHLADDLGMDSITKSEIIIWLDENYEVADIESSELNTIADIVMAASGLNKQVKTDIVKTPKKWLDTNRPKPIIPHGNTIQYCFLKKCDEMGNKVAIADEMAGILTWSEFKTGTIIFANIFKTYPGNYIGIMLPSSAIANLVIFATLLSGKTPVMLNWTVGRKNIEHACDTVALDQIITSSKFLDKVDNVEFGEVEEKFVFLEEIKKEKIGLGEKLIALLQARKKADKIFQFYELDKIKEVDPAVILFTSGSESAPKGVPLTHSNLLSNTRAAFDIMQFNENSTLYGFLPPFHSFGFTVTTILPTIAGIKSAYHPNPTEGRRLAHGCEYYRATVMCGTPTFINGIFKGSKKNQLDSLLHILCGAEKLPESLIEQVENLPETTILEGYGITECSPVITINRPDEKREGVGRPLSGVEIKIVNMDNYEPAKKDERGLILVKGDNVFSSYLGIDKNPFIELDGENWYNTGDLGYLTEFGALVLSGRLKRFVKIAGEMISLPAIEEALGNYWPPNDDGPTVAVQSLELEDKRPELWLFSAMEINIEESNDVLKKSGFSNLGRLKKVIVLKEMPKLGTGKIDYQSLKKMME